MIYSSEFWTYTGGNLQLMDSMSFTFFMLNVFFRVEFQSKFYKGLGYAFVPFSFDKILEEGRYTEANI